MGLLQSGRAAQHVAFCGRFAENQESAACRRSSLMRKWTAASLLMVVLMLMSAPIAFALPGREAQSRVPMCCRKGGRHHCSAMQTESSSTAGPTWSALPQHCPLYPGQAPLVVVDAKLFVPAPRAALFAAIWSHPAIQAQTEALYRISFDRSRLKRGPPVLI